MMDYLKAFRKTADPHVFENSSSIEAAWKSPSNIALIKYWGKKPGQIPANASLSLTLDKAATFTAVRAFPSHSHAERSRSMTTVNDDPSHSFILKLQKLLDLLVPELPVLNDLRFEVRTQNSFPHSAGIASSASGISAFSLCLLDIIRTITHASVENTTFFRAASYVSRIGSGSACRSLYEGFTIWGKTSLLSGSSNLEAVPFNEWIHHDFHQMHDAILLVSSEPKSMASSLGHSLMDHHPFASGRYRQAGANLEMVVKALITGDFKLMADITEMEALSLHALMMTSGENGMLLKPNTLNLIQKIRKARNDGLAVCFTLDAGPNIHLLYPKKSEKAVEQFVRNELLLFCENHQVIFDHYGKGPVPINTSLF